MTEFQVYWWVKLTDIQTALTAISITVLVCLVIWAIINYLENLKQLKSIIPLSIIPIFIGLVALAMPNSMQYATIKVLPLITTNKTVEKIPKDMDDLYDVSIDYLKNQLKSGGE